MRRRRTKIGSSALPELPPAIPGLIWASQVKPGRIDWLWPGAIPAGCITLIEGRKSTGKSTLTAAIVASLTGGPVVPGWVGPRRGRVLWQHAEESYENCIVPRLDRAAADTNLVAKIGPIEQSGKKRRCVLPDDITILADYIRDAQVQLLVLDPFISLCSPSLDVRIEQQARLYLEPLVPVLEATGCTALLTRHIRKGQGGDAREAGLGSVAIGNVARSIIRCDEHPHERGRFVMSVVACSYGSRLPTQVYSFDFQGSAIPRVVWHGSTDLDSDSIAEGRGGEALRDEWADADYLLHQCIGSNWVRVKDLQDEALEAGIGWGVVRRSKTRLGVRKRRTLFGEAGCWEWGPPVSGWPPGLGEPEPEEPPKPAPKRKRSKAPKALKAHTPKSVPLNGEGGTEKPVSALDTLSALEEGGNGETAS